MYGFILRILAYGTINPTPEKQRRNLVEVGVALNFGGAVLVQTRGSRLRPDFVHTRNRIAICST